MLLASFECSQTVISKSCHNSPKKRFTSLKLKVCWCQVAMWSAMWVSFWFICIFLFKSVFTICWCCFLFLTKNAMMVSFEKAQVHFMFVLKSFWAIGRLLLIMSWAFHKQNHYVLKEFGRYQWSIRCNLYYYIL